MSRTSAVRSEADVATLRHELLTPLNHLIGFSEMLLADSHPDRFDTFIQHLTRIREIAKDLARVVRTRLASGQGKPAAKLVDELRTQLSGPLHTILQAVGSITSELSGEFNLSDVLKIGGAASELLAFSQGRSLAKPGVAPSRRRSFNGPGRKRPQAPASGRVLVVDDNDMSRGLLTRHLTRQGHAVTEAGSGAEALAILGNSKFDVVLLDLLMPKLDGFQVLEQIKADPALADVAVIVVSALDEVPGVVRCIEIGAEDYLFKPFDPVLLAARIDSCLDKKRLLDGARQHSQDLDAAYQRLRRALNSVPVRIWDWDLARNRVIVLGELNTKRGLPAEENELSLEEVISTVHPGDQERVRNGLTLSIERREDYHAEFRMAPDGSTIWVESAGILYFDQAKTPIRMVGVTRDITRRKRLERALRKCTEDAQQFASDAAQVSNELAALLDACPAGAGQKTIRSAVNALRRLAKRSGEPLAFSRSSPSFV